MNNKKIILAFFFILIIIILPVCFADDKYFYVYDTGGPYKAEPGAIFNMNITIDNKGLVDPKNVTVRVMGCPSDWTCGSKTVSFNKSGRNIVPLKVIVPEYSSEKRYSLLVSLYSYWRTERGDELTQVWVSRELPIAKSSYVYYPAGDNTQVNVVKETPKITYSYPIPDKKESVKVIKVKLENNTNSEQATPVKQVDLDNLDAISYEEIDEGIKKQETDEKQLGNLEKSLDKDTKEVQNINPVKSSVKDNLSKNFWSYLTIALYILLILVAFGIFKSYLNNQIKTKKKKTKKKK